MTIEQTVRAGVAYAAMPARGRVRKILRDTDLIAGRWPEAKTPEEFLAMLRAIVLDRGLTAGQVATYSGLPRSTAYHFLSKKNTTLPKHREQVARFADACNLEPGDISRLLWNWEKLRSAQSVGSTANIRTHSAAPAALEPKVAPSAACPACRNSNRPIVIEVDPESTATDELDTRSWSVRSRVLLMLLVAVQPLLIAAEFGQPGERVSLTLFASMSVALHFSVPILARMPSMRSRTRLGAAAVFGIGTSLLTLAAAASTIVAMVTGFAVFIATPMWLENIRSMRLLDRIGAISAVFTAIWFGAVAGSLASIASVPRTGAILIGLLSAAAALMETTTRTVKFRHAV